MYIGDYAEDYPRLNKKFTTRTTAGVPSTLGGTPVITVYKKNDTTPVKTSAEAYITLTADFNGKTGLNNVLIDLSGDVFFEPGEDYEVVLTTGTVNSVNVANEVLFSFSIENRFDEVDVTKIGGATQSATDLKDFADVGYDPVEHEVLLVNTTTTNTDMVGTTGANTVTPPNAAAIQTACNAALVANFLDRLFKVNYDPASKPGVDTALLNELIANAAGVSVFKTGALANAPDSDTTTDLTLHGDYDAAKTAAQPGADADTLKTLSDQLDALTTLIGTAGDALTALPWNSSWDSEVQSEVNDALVVLGLDHLVAVADADDPVNNSIFAKLASATGDWSTFVAATHSLQALLTQVAALITTVGVDGVGLTGLARLILPAQNGAFAIDFEMLLTDGTVATGKTVTVQRSLVGAAYEAAEGETPGETGSGTYEYTTVAADTNAAKITLKFSAPGCRASFVHLHKLAPAA